MKASKIGRIIRWKNALKTLESNKHRFSSSNMNKYDELHNHILQRIEKEKKLLKSIMFKRGAIGLGIGATAAGIAYGAHKIKQKKSITKRIN